MRYRIRLSRLAESYLRRLDARTRARFEVEFRASRVGGWRILYTVNSVDRVLEVNDIGPRGQIYRRR